MKTTIFLLIIMFSTTLCQEKQLSLEETWNVSESFNLKKNIRTTISMYDQDSMTVFYLFDNIVIKDASLRFILSDQYWCDRGRYDDDLILPLPPLENKLYYIKFSSKEYTFIKKFLYIK